MLFSINIVSQNEIPLKLIRNFNGLLKNPALKSHKSVRRNLKRYPTHLQNKYNRKIPENRRKTTEITFQICLLVNLPVNSIKFFFKID